MQLFPLCGDIYILVQNTIVVAVLFKEGSNSVKYTNKHACSPQNI